MICLSVMRKTQCQTHNPSYSLHSEVKPPILTVPAVPIAPRLNSFRDSGHNPLWMPVVIDATND